MFIRFATAFSLDFSFLFYSGGTAIFKNCRIWNLFMYNRTTTSYSFHIIYTVDGWRRPKKSLRRLLKKIKKSTVMVRSYRVIPKFKGTAKNKRIAIQDFKNCNWFGRAVKVSSKKKRFERQFYPDVYVSRGRTAIRSPSSSLP